VYCIAKEKNRNRTKTRSGKIEPKLNWTKILVWFRFWQKTKPNETEPTPSGKPSRLLASRVSRRKKPNITLVSGMQAETPAEVVDPEWKAQAHKCGVAYSEAQRLLQWSSCQNEWSCLARLDTTWLQTSCLAWRGLKLQLSAMSHIYIFSNSRVFKPKNSCFYFISFPWLTIIPHSNYKLYMHEPTYAIYNIYIYI